MGSRYDIAVYRGTTLPDFMQALDREEPIGPVVEGPWAGASQMTIAQVDTANGPNTVVAAPPMRRPRGIDSRLAKRLGVEALFATVWDSVSTYSLRVVGEGVDRSLSAEPDEEDGGAPLASTHGEPLPEEPGWPDLDEAYVQQVFKGRCGIDPGVLRTYDAVWYAYAPSS